MRFDTLSAAVEAVSFTVSTTRLITVGLRGRGLGAGRGAGFGAGRFAAAFLAGAFLAGAFFAAAFLAGARRFAALFFPPARRAEVFFAAFFVAFLEDLPEDFFFGDFLAAMRFLLLKRFEWGSVAIALHDGI